MARKQLKAFLPKDAADLLKVRDIVLGQPGRPIDPPPGQYIPPPDGIPFINDSGEEMPTRAIGAIKAYVLADNGTVYAEIEKPGTTFRQQYVVNTSRQPIADQGLGFCQFSSSYRIAHDTSWAPATGESGGPKPGSWLLWKGYPSICNVIGRADVANDILLGTLSPITVMLGKTTGAITGGTSTTTAYQIWTGTSGSEANGGWTTVPGAISRVNIGSGKFVKLTFVNNGWIMEPLECG